MCRNHAALMLAVAALAPALAAARGADAADSRAQGAAATAAFGSGVAWALQISDTHVSRYAHPDIVPDLEAFSDSVVAGARPSAVLITGDLVDGKSANQEGSRQHPQEWQVRARASMRRSAYGAPRSRKRARAAWCSATRTPRPRA